LKAKHDALSYVAFKFNLRRYTMAAHMQRVLAGPGAPPGTGLHSSTSHLNLSRF
jgi:hypothetical protein